MDKIDYRAVIKYLLLKGNTCTQIKDESDSIKGNSASSFTTVKFWIAEFKCRFKNLGDDERSTSPNTATTTKTLPKVHQLVLDN
ncbi:HTH_48 domain-containing protein [Trichonephila clavipes]|nr:HTH_48 domain-containing protein [Trichonephila clavipes]